MVSVDIFGPVSQPGDSIIMLKLFPLSRNIRYGYWAIFADVKNNILGMNSILDSRLARATACLFRNEL